MLFSVGWATQRWLTGSQKDEAGIERDGIIVTCDANALDILDPQATTDYFIPYFIPYELKATYQSSNKAVEENQYWIRQVMAQCYVTRSTAAYLSRFELMGDWKIKDGNRPTLSAWLLEFTKEELERNWLWLQQRKTLFEEILQTGILLPKIVAIPSGQTYECDWCHFKGAECQVG